MVLPACDDFLNIPPEDKFTDEEFWKNETQARSFVMGVYTGLFGGFGTAQNPDWLESVGDDAFSDEKQAPFSPDIVPNSDGSWSFTSIRRANYVIASAPRMTEPEECINHWVGIGRFLRAYSYSSLVFQYGDVPYFDRVPAYSEEKEDLDYLFKPRDPRAYVIGRIIEDFEFALQNVRLNDGKLQINRYVVAALASRMMLREGTFQKYFYGDNETAKQCLELAKAASELAMSGPYSLAGDYKSLFVSDDLEGNPEIILYRKYVDGQVAHYMLNQCYDIEQSGAGKSLTESFLRSDGFPLYYNDASWYAPNAAAFFQDRDPRLSACIRPSGYYPFGGSNAPFGYARSGYSIGKYMNDALIGSGYDFTRGKNVTDAPVLRLAEVLLNYAEICYELESITGNDTFNQSVLDITINLLRDRVGMPHLEELNGQPAVNGLVYDDPKRSLWEPANDVSAMLWEIRRERRVELCYENGLRSADLKRWKKLDYLCNVHNPDYRYGAYIALSDYPAAVKEAVKLAPFVGPEEQPVAGLPEGYIIRNNSASGSSRILPQPRNYVKPVPIDQMDLYTLNGYTLTQTQEWQ
jgi:hypothetical protein